MCVGFAAACCSSIALSLGCATCTAVGGVVSKATRFTYALMLLMATFLAVAMLTVSVFLSRSLALPLSRARSISRSHTHTVCLQDALKSWIMRSFQEAWSLPQVECDGLECFSPAKLQEQAQNELVNRTVASTEQRLAIKLERVVGALAVNRVMLGVAVFHGLMALVLTGVENSKDARAKLQNDAWSLKVALYLGSIALMFWVNTALFDSVTTLFKVGAFLFILIQLTMLIDGAYNSYEFLAERMDIPAWQCLTVGSTVLMYGFCFFVFGATVAKHSREEEGCRYLLPLSLCLSVSLSLRLFVCRSCYL